jgi:hypothetical protein
MANFDVKCPYHNPMKCNLSPADKEYLETPEKYKAFFILQYNDNDEYLEPVLEKYFNDRTWRLFNAGKEAGQGTKFCNVCRYALASDFGIACLTPLNHNVFQEIGLMMGLQKPVLYLYNPGQIKKEEKLPFDIDDQIYIEYTSKDELEQGLEKEMGLLIDKVELFSEYQKRFRESLQQKVDNLIPQDQEILKLFLIESRPLKKLFLYKLSVLDKFKDWDSNFENPLKDSGLIIRRIQPTDMQRRYEFVWEINHEYRDVLREIVFKN